MKLWHWTILTTALGAAACGSSTSPTDVTTPPMPVAEPTTPPPAAEARYRVTFRTLWSQATHPDRFPSNPHFSPLVGATHNGSVRFWEVGGIASEGIERMSELGSTSPLDSIIRDAIAAGRAQSLLQGSGINPAPGEASLELTVTRDFSYVTLVSMVAPSPDWFVGISARNFLESGNWPAELVFELFPYDAGTDDGETYNSPDDDTEPQDPISRMDNPPFRHMGTVRPLGTFTFVRIP